MGNGEILTKDPSRYSRKDVYVSGSGVGWRVLRKLCRGVVTLEGGGGGGVDGFSLEFQS